MPLNPALKRTILTHLRTSSASLETQIALVSARCLRLRSHVAQNPRDRDSKWGLTVLDRRRQALLVELARHDVRRYQALAAFLDLPVHEHEACLAAWRKSRDMSGELR